MPAYKDKKTGKWYASFYCDNWKGVREKKMKRGFATKKEALEWEREFLLKSNANLDMKFDSFVEIYITDVIQRLKRNTMQTKKNIIYNHIVPYFKDMKMCDIAPKDIIKWQNEIMAFRNNKGEPFSQTYLSKIHSQLSAIFNHAVRYYELKDNPAEKAGSMGSKDTAEIEFWTKEEYLKFIDEMMDKPISFYAFEVLYWCGLRVGELLALTPEDFDLEKKTLRINKSYQRLEREDVITLPKTTKSIRTIKLPDFLCAEIEDYLKMQYKIKETDRMFPLTKNYLHREMTRGAKASGVKRITIHDLRHSHVSLLIDLGYSAVAIADRVGHESIEITYRYAHLFPSKQIEMAETLDNERMDKNVC